MAFKKQRNKCVSLKKNNVEIYLRGITNKDLITNKELGYSLSIP